MADQDKTQKKADDQEELSADQLKNVAGGAGRPPSGDANPSDLSNSTVDTSDIVDPHAK
ncbi:MAG: hypothetical protein F6K28_44475 [Microcoleus sp. SIO2G3]|nr:hypothetical protein [Microcoleus sp. SIO2G3]